VAITNTKQQINEMHQNLSTLNKEIADNKENLLRVYKVFTFFIIIFLRVRLKLEDGKKMARSWSKI
jgi:hypothetical protein